MLNRATVFKLWDYVTTSFWFIPAIMTSGAIVAGLALPALEQIYYRALPLDALVGTFTPASARALLTTVAGVMVSVTGIVFSITILTLSTASSQLGPRLMRTFMGRNSTQVALGMFLSTAIYALTLLPHIREGLDLHNFPVRSVLLALIAGVTSLVFLIFFIHNVARSIQANTVIAIVAAELDSSITRNMLEPCEDKACENVNDSDKGADGLVLCSKQEGYIQGVDVVDLVAVAADLDTTIYLTLGPGDFVAREEPIARLDRDIESTEDLDARLSAAIAVGIQRTPFQDIECPIAELAEVGIRALSPGINDPFTALTCIDRLSAALSTMVSRSLPEGVGRDDDGNVRVVYRVRGYRSAFDAAYNQIGHFGRDNIVVLSRIAQALERIAIQCGSDLAKDAVRAHCLRLRNLSERYIESEEEREDLIDLIETAESKLDVNRTA